MLNTAALAIVNHLLSGEDWARQRLRGFAGQTARLRFGRLAWTVKISASGMLEVADATAAATVSIVLPDDAPVRALTDRSALFSAATVAGSAELAETLGFVFRNLRWDAEQDLAQLLGDVLARRGVRLASELARWQASGARNVAANLSEYLTEEQAVVAPRRLIESFCGEVDVIRDDLARFEKRVERLLAAARQVT